MKWSAIKETLPLLLTFCAVLVIGIVFFSYSQVDAALLEPTDTQPTINTNAVVTEPTTTGTEELFPDETEDTIPLYEEVEQPIIVTVAPTNIYATVLAIGLGIILVIGIILIIIPIHRHGPRH